MIWETSSPCAKFVGDFGSATETMRIIDLFALQVFAKNLDRCNFRLLQHYRAHNGLRSGIAPCPKWAKADPKPEAYVRLSPIASWTENATN